MATHATGDGMGNEAWLVNGDAVDWKDRAHCFAIAAKAGRPRTDRNQRCTDGATELTRARRKAAYPRSICACSSPG
jgi:hypothetical protein